VVFAELPIDINVAAVKIFEVPCWCRKRLDHPLAGAAKVSTVDLDAMPFVTLFPMHITHVGAAEVFFQVNVDWDVVADPPARPSSRRPASWLFPLNPRSRTAFGMFRPSVRTPSRTAVAIMDRFREALEPDRTPLR